MNTLKTEIEINASPAEVWLVLTQFHSYELWNPFISQVKGFCNLGEKVKIVLTPSRSRHNKRITENYSPNEKPAFDHENAISLNKSSSFKVKVTKFETERWLQWKKRHLIYGTYIQDFQLHPTNHGTTIFYNDLQMGGLLINLTWEMFTKHWYQGGLELMNEALKAKVESESFYVDVDLANERV